MSLGYGGGGSTVVVWSPPWEYDLGDRQQRGRAYERVMTEGLDEDVLWFIDVDEVVAMWGRAASVAAHPCAVVRSRARQRYARGLPELRDQLRERAHTR